jgi:L-alanine-DL-glutamate epimerase-like enolase superfamily enzyme
VGCVAEGAAGVTIAAVRLFPYAIPLTRPWKCARGDTVLRRGWLIRVEDSEGAHGWGESAGLPGAGTETAELAEVALARAVAAMPGLAPTRRAGSCRGVTGRPRVAGWNARYSTSRPAARECPCIATCGRMPQARCA